MEIEKYYVPAIEEFHVGFDIECNVKGEWIPLKYMQNFKSGNGSPTILETYSILQNIRVKYLDREDIESFGFKNKEDVSSISNEVFMLSKSNGGFNDTTIYKLSKSGNILSIKFKIETSWGGGEGQCFYGTIKNKSEFSRLLKQLSII